ncbi:MAG: hypothetical protein FWG40_06975 [Peptococcaceae bacterium]|nr:hypothetical protein [Peptococcaceae bacterium]
MMFRCSQPVQSSAFSSGLSKSFLLACLLAGLFVASLCMTACVHTVSPEMSATGTESTDPPTSPEMLRDLLTEIEIIGNTGFKENTQKALAVVNQSEKASGMVSAYIGRIRQDSSSGMMPYLNPPTYNVSSLTYNASTAWYASTIVHDAYHSKLYHDYLLENSGRVPDNVWTGETAEMKCLEVQIVFLEDIQAWSLADYAKSLRGANWWNGPITW